ncbi:hypothetical protein P7C70_g8959, partial [Phenoliferia sp. Uapishka_3]
MPTLRTLPDATLILTHAPAIKAALSKLSKQSLCALALAWVDDPISTPAATSRKRHRREVSQESEESESEEEEEEELEDDIKSVYEEMRDEERVKKGEVVKTVMRHWSRGLSYKQRAQMDIQILQDKPTSRSWTAYQLIHTVAAPSYTTPAQLASRLRVALSPYHTH